jgi:enamine deaminase RidA (YjgF/YER057c/UK114 family)
MSSPDVWVGGWGFICGLGPVDLGNPAVPLPEAVEDQVRQIVANLDGILKKRSLTREQVVSARIHLVDFKRFHERVNRTWGELFAGAREPAKSCIGVVALPRGALVEMDLIVKEGS